MGGRPRQPREWRVEGSMLQEREAASRLWVWVSADDDITRVGSTELNYAWEVNQ